MPHSCKACRRDGRLTGTCGSTSAGAPGGDADSLRATRRNWSRWRRTSSWPWPSHPWFKCHRRPAPCRPCSCRFPIRSGPVSLQAWRAGRQHHWLHALGIRLQRNGWSCARRSRRASRATVLRDPSNPSGTGQFGAIQAMAPSLRGDLSPVDMRDAGGIEPVIAAVACGSTGGMIVLPGSLMITHRAQIIVRQPITETAYGLSLPLLRRRRRPNFPWARCRRPVSARGRLRRSHSQG
jgi:hypothetical protein